MGQYKINKPLTTSTDWFWKIHVQNCGEQDLKDVNMPKAKA